MKTKLYSVFDSKAAVYSVPFFMPNEAMAIRSFTDLVNEPGTMAHKHPEDFSLIELGGFDDQTGVVESQAHRNLGNAASFKKVAPTLDFTSYLGKQPFVTPKVENGKVVEEVRS